jgi:hypothetical protein
VKAADHAAGVFTDPPRDQMITDTSICVPCAVVRGIGENLPRAAPRENRKVAPTDRRSRRHAARVVEADERRGWTPEPAIAHGEVLASSGYDASGPLPSAELDTP